MPYEPGTILTLKNPKPDDPETGEVFPYNRVEVVGPSPIDHGQISPGQWQGAAAQGVVLRPLSNFGGVLDEAEGKVQALYDVESIPETVVDMVPQVKIIHSTSQSAGPTPEEVFAAEAPGDPDAPRRRSQVVSPLEDPRPKAGDGPLGPVPA